MASYFALRATKDESFRKNSLFDEMASFRKNDFKHKNQKQSHSQLGSRPHRHPRVGGDLVLVLHLEQLFQKDTSN